MNKYTRRYECDWTVTIYSNKSKSLDKKMEARTAIFNVGENADSVWVADDAMCDYKVYTHKPAAAEGRADVGETLAKNRSKELANGRDRHSGDDADERLWREWLLNWGVNPVCNRYAWKMGVCSGNSRHVFEGMKACREFCKKMGVWFESEPEAYMFYDMGENDEDDDFHGQFADEVRRLREWCKKRGHNWRNYKYTADTVCLVEHERIDTDAWFDAYYDESTYNVI